MMKQALILVLFLLFISMPLYAQSIDEVDLRGLCAFKPGDDETWRSKFIDERESWNFLTAPGAWERFGYKNLDGFAWYRFRFQLPKSLREDSLILVADAIDDVDAAYMNGWFIGQTGSFPPNARSEVRTRRVYPIPKRFIEEYNCLAFRVFDCGDSGGIVGRTLKLVRASKLRDILAALPSEIFNPVAPPLSNGLSLASFNQEGNRIESFYPHIFAELEPALLTENTVDRIALSFTLDGQRTLLDTLRPLLTEYLHQTGIVHQLFRPGIELFWYLPSCRSQRIITILLQHPTDVALDDVALHLTMLKPAWAYREIVTTLGESQRHYFVLSYNSCCREFAERDLNDFFREHATPQYSAESLERELISWGALRAQTRVPARLDETEASIFRQSVTTLLMAQNREEGSGFGQIISAFEPASKRNCRAADHAMATAALAAAGLTLKAADALLFSLRRRPQEFLFFNVYGDEFGVGIPYRITPFAYLGSGEEKIPAKKESAALTQFGAAGFLLAFNSYVTEHRRLEAYRGRRFADTALVGDQWNILSREVADVLLNTLDSTHRLRRDAGPWGTSLSTASSIGSTIAAAAALRIASRYAATQNDTLRQAIYRVESESIVHAIRSRLNSIAGKKSEGQLTAEESELFDPLLLELITLGLVDARSDLARQIVELVEASFRLGADSVAFTSKPDGDWFERQERPYIALLLARAHAVGGNAARAEMLFRHIVEFAAANHGLIPELRDPITGNWYGGIPSVAWGAAAYIHTAITISEMRINSRREVPSQ